MTTTQKKYLQRIFIWLMIAMPPLLVTYLFNTFYGKTTVLFEHLMFAYLVCFVAFIVIYMIKILQYALLSIAALYAVYFPYSLIDHHFTLKNLPVLIPFYTALAILFMLFL